LKYDKSVFISSNTQIINNNIKMKEKNKKQENNRNVKQHFCCVLNSSVCVWVHTSVYTSII